MWLLTIIYFGLVSANPTFGFWGPTIIADLGVKGSLMIGLLSAIPYLVSVIGIVWVGRHSDRKLERRYHCALSCLTAAAGLVLIGVFQTSPVFAFAALILGVTGVLSAFSPFCKCRPMLLSGTAAAGRIALYQLDRKPSGWLAPFWWAG